MSCKLKFLWHVLNIWKYGTAKFHVIWNRFVAPNRLKTDWFQKTEPICTVLGFHWVQVVNLLVLVSKFYGY